MRITLAHIAAVLMLPPGDNARQMAAAPLASKEKNDAPANRFAIGGKVFSAIAFIPRSGKVYDEGGRKTTKLAEVLLTIADSGLKLKGSVKAVQPAGAKSAHPEFNLFGSANPPAVCVAVDDPQAMAEYDAFRKHVARVLYPEYRKNAGTTTVNRQADPDEVDLGIVL